MRDAAHLNPAGGMHADDIAYPSIDGPSPFSHPLCQNTSRDGKFLGNEAPPNFDNDKTLRQADRAAPADSSKK